MLSFSCFILLFFHFWTGGWTLDWPDWQGYTTSV